MRLICFLLFYGLCTFFAYGQVLVTRNDKIEVFDVHGKYLAQGYYSDLTEAVAGNNIVIIRFLNHKIEVRSLRLNYISSAYFADVERISAEGDYVVVYYQNGRVEVRDEKLKFISAWYR